MAEITTLYGGFLGLFFLVLTARIIRYRRSNLIAYGDANQPAFTPLVRAHGNFTETVPIALILMGLAEINGAPSMMMHIAGLLLLSGRIMHGLGLPSAYKPFMWRTLGMVQTLTAILLASLLALVY